LGILQKGAVEWVGKEKLTNGGSPTRVIGGARSCPLRGSGVKGIKKLATPAKGKGMYNLTQSTGTRKK